MKLLQRICLLAAVPAVLALCILRTPLRFGADSSAFSDAVPVSCEVGGEAVEARETTLPQGQNELHLRSWTRNGEDVCVMGSFQTAHRTHRSRAIWSAEIADEALSVRWFDGQIWHKEPIKVGRYRSNTAFFITGHEVSVLCYTPQVWALLENGSRQLTGNWLGYMQTEQTRDGWRLSLCAPKMGSGSAADFVCVTAADPNAIDWSREGIPALWSAYRNAGSGRWCFDGYYAPSPDTYVPTGTNVFFRNPASYLTKSFLYQTKSSRTAVDLSIAMLDTLIREQNSDGFWPTLSGSTWLESAYGIGPGFYDTRFNTEFAFLLLEAQYRCPSELYRDSLRRYCDFFADFAEDFHSETGSRGWFVPDYVDSSLTHTAHTSLNHLLAEILLLYKAADVLEDRSLAALADRMLTAVDDSGESWVREDDDLHYQVSPDGVFEGIDYPYLTYDDLFKLQKYLNARFSRNDPVLDTLMAHKRTWMDENGVTAYMK